MEAKRNEQRGWTADSSQLPRSSQATNELFNSLLDRPGGWGEFLQASPVKDTAPKASLLILCRAAIWRISRIRAYEVDDDSQILSPGAAGRQRGICFILREARRPGRSRQQPAFTTATLCRADSCWCGRLQCLINMQFLISMYLVVPP